MMRIHHQLLLATAVCAKTIHINPPGANFSAVLTAAASGDVLLLSNGVYILGSSSRSLIVDKDITIAAQNIGQAVLDGQHSGGVLSITSGAVHLIGLSITNGRTDPGDSTSSGGGVLIQGSATRVQFDHCNINDNAATNDGGGVSIEDGNVAFSNCSFASNKAGNGKGPYSYHRGGGLCITGGTASFDSCKFDSNTADFGGGLYIGTPAGGQPGQGAGTVTMTNCDINSNTVVVGGGGGVYNHYGYALFQNSRVYDNSCAYIGGGIVITGGNTTIASSQVHDNTASVDGGGVAVIDGAVQPVLDTKASSIINNSPENCVGFTAPACGP